MSSEGAIFDLDYRRYDGERTGRNKIRLAMVRDESLIQTAVDEALAANPDVAEKIRGGKVAAVGAVVGAVMKATKGQADAARVRELVLKACGQEA